ncbi:MAG: hypothetical protein EHM24_12675 [Acidobacteria bacterium]|nr:MAG: hypothetical protein EHM24_12675 [Acidobacteriota bacterium]
MALLLAGAGALALPASGEAQEPATAGAKATEQAGLNDLDAFMARVLERRDETWRKLHDYILGEREAFQILGPGDVPLYGMKRDYSWYVREGFLVRSPVRFDGVELSDRERREYEEKWLTQEKEREKRARERAAKEKAGQDPGKEKTAISISPGGVKVTKTPADVSQAEAPPAGEPAVEQEGDPSLQAFVDQRGEPRFISEAYFLRFKFEPGNYYLVGREQFDGRQVLRIEYYPTGLFGDERGEAQDPAPGKPEKPGRKDRRRERDKEDEIERKMNKASLVTLWVDPAEDQIVKYTFDNMDFGFLPGRWLVRVDGASASMTMARVFDGVWLPSRISMGAGLSLASGGYRFQYGREFSDYRKAEVGARIRSYVPKEPRP